MQKSAVMPAQMTFLRPVASMAARMRGSCQELILVR